MLNCFVLWLFPSIFNAQKFILGKSLKGTQNVKANLVLLDRESLKAVNL